MEAPSWFVQREQALLGDRYAALYTPKTETAARGVTVNTLRCTTEQFAQLADFDIAPSPFCGAAFAVCDATVKLGRHPYHHAGVFYSQEPSAASPAALLEVRPGMKVLDTCAAPGGKSSQLAAALQGQGLLVANEYVAGRAEILRQNLERMGVTNAVVLNEDTARLAAAFPGFFDRVLVDAPCSGEGMFRKEAVAVTQHSEALVQQCAALGAQILENAAAMLAPGGILVYSTCTFAPQEDEAQVVQFLAHHPEFTLCDLSAAGFGRPGESNRAGENPPEGFNAAYCRRIWPADGGEGHFMAKLQKATGAMAVSTLPETAASVAINTSAPYKAKGKGKSAKGGKGPKSKVEPQNGNALQPWLDFAKLYFPALAQAPVTQFKEMLLLEPQTPLPVNHLHCLRSGVLAGSVAKNRFVPAHALFMAYGAQCINREELTLADPRTMAWLHGEEIEAQTAHDGWCAVLVDGFPLGCGKISNGRVKNHYPKALRNVT